MTKIKNIQTGEITEITIIDPKTRLDWSGDFIGNTVHGMESGGEDADWQSDEETIDWWVQYAIEYEKADFRLYEAMQNESDEDWYDLYNEYLSVEVNDLADAMNKMADYLENK